MKKYVALAYVQATIQFTFEAQDDTDANDKCNAEFDTMWGRLGAEEVTLHELPLIMAFEKGKPTPERGK